VIQFVETNRPFCFHELNHKLLAAPLRAAPPRSMCVLTLSRQCGHRDRPGCA
jgi:hypothetical protein